jgi:hypothetical protein
MSIYSDCQWLWHESTDKNEIQFVIIRWFYYRRESVRVLSLGQEEDHCWSTMVTPHQYFKISLLKASRSVRVEVEILLSVEIAFPWVAKWKTWYVYVILLSISFPHFLLSYGARVGVRGTVGYSHLAYCCLWGKNRLDLLCLM